MDHLALADWRRQTAGMYADVRATPLVEWRDAWSKFRLARDRLFELHDQTPLTAEQLKSFTGLSYHPYDAAWRLLAELEPIVDGSLHEIDLPVEGRLRFRQMAWLHFQIAERDERLALYWIEGYGGGLFLPFRDRSNGDSSYGGGRYLYDGIKGADFSTASRLPLDFNFAYNPSCAYNERWVCPLAPQENWLPFAVEAGEKKLAL